ncbi:Zinc (Zn2)-Iron (Fe2) Permease (ZIP) Family, partial [Thraustotheca clavata]
MVFYYPISVLLLFVLTTFVIGHSHEGGEEHHQHECGEIEGDPSTYNTNIHISAAFIVCVVSLVGSLLPILSSRMACLQGENKAMEILCSFGFGVVIATAFVHMIPPAISKLNNECLGLEYSGLAMIIVLATIYMMQLLETELVIVLSKYTSSKQNQLEQGTLSTPARSPDVLNSHSHGVAMLQEDSEAALRQKISAMIFEGGVAIHSIIIGVELGVASGDDFTTTVIAICFHQFFEGVAVGSSAITAFSSLKSLALTAIVYALTTPLGVVIGILISG